MGLSFSELSEKYKDIKLTLICLADFNIKDSPHYYKAIFEYINYYGNKKYPVAEIPSELFNKKYKIGAQFINGIQIGYSEDIMVSSFEINNTIPLKPYKISDVLNDSDIQIIEEKSLYKYFLQQNCFFIKYNDYDLIIPHYTIANHFHFRSASLRNAILDNTFTYLYVPNSFKRNPSNPNKVQLKIKNLTNQSDIVTICSFLNDTKIFDSFKKYVKQRANTTSKYGIQQIEAQFPFMDIFNIKTLCKQINTLGKTKILVLGIYQDDYQYDFNEVDYILDRSNATISLRSTPAIFIKEKPKLNQGKIKNKTPSGRYLINNEVFFENDFYDINEIRLNPIYMGVSNNIPLVIEEISKNVNGSYEKATAEGNKELQQIAVSMVENSNKKELELFSIDKFDILFEALSIHNEVSNAIITNKTPLIPRKNENNRIPPKYYIFSNIIRCYKYGSFLFRNTKIAFIEIESGGSWKKITSWFFILPDIKFSFNNDNVNDIVFKYLGTDDTLKVIEESLKEKNNIIFIRKNHPEISLPEKAISEWVKDILYKYIYPNIQNKDIKE